MGQTAGNIFLGYWSIIKDNRFQVSLNPDIIEMY